MKKYIKDIVFEYIIANNGKVDYPELTKKVLIHNPNSKWKKTHWTWYKNQILSETGKYNFEFSKEQKINIKNYRSSSLKGAIHLPKLSSKTFEFKYVDNSKVVEQELAIILGRVTHHIHPQIIEYITNENIEYKERFKNICHPKLNLDLFFYKESDCLFPGVRRPINSEKQKAKNNTVYEGDGTIFDDNIFPRNIWTFLTANKSYSGPIWKNSGLNTFELAHIFAHKTEEQQLEKKVFKQNQINRKPYGLFTSASNVVLIPKGLAKPTDKMESIKIVFYQRHLDLYGNNLIGLENFDKSKLPSWYNKIVWLEPELPPDWKIKIDNLLKYRDRQMLKKYS